MFILAPIPTTATEYKIVDIRRTSVFAGKLGQRVSEDLVVENNGIKILVHIAGSYHTLIVRKSQRLNLGDTISIKGSATDGATIARDRIVKA